MDRRGRRENDSGTGDHLGMQRNELLPITPTKLGVSPLCNSAHPSLGAPDAISNSLLLHAGCQDLVHDGFPVHTGDYQETISQGQQHPDRLFKHNPDMDTLAKRLKHAREQLCGLSQPELARKSGVKQSFIGALEAENQQSSSWLPELAHALGVEAYWLKTGKGPMRISAAAQSTALIAAEAGSNYAAPDPETDKLLRLIKQIPTAERTALTAMLEIRFDQTNGTTKGKSKNSQMDGWKDWTEKPPNLLNNENK